MLRGRALTDRAGSSICTAYRVAFNHANALPPTRNLLSTSFFVSAHYGFIVGCQRKEPDCSS